MIWLNPWAWAGLVAVALPILIHLLGRGPAHVQRFPTLRFLDASRVLPARRTRLHDLALLAVRVGILVAAVAALAHPLWLTTNRQQALGDPLARAIIVDTSASMQRVAARGERGIAAARRIVTQLADSAQSSVVLESATPAQAIAGAAAWLSTQPSRGEIDIVSDFQVGALDARDLRAVPQRVGLRLSQVDVAHDSIVETRTRIGGTELLASATPLPDRTHVEWTSLPVAAATVNPVMLLAGDHELPRLEAAKRAAATVGVSDRRDTTHAVAIVYPDFGERAAMVRSARMPSLPWMTTVVLQLSEDSLLVNAAADAERSPIADSTTGLVIARTHDGRPVVSAVESTEQRRARLVLVAYVDAGSLTSAALLAAVARAQAPATPAAELEPNTLSSDLVAHWQRAPSAIAPSQANGGEGSSDARWLWLVALLLLGIETWMRRSPGVHVA
jgi:hypothetical protein